MLYWQEEKLRALSQRDDFARQLGKDPAGLFPPGSKTMPGEQAFKYAEVLEKRMKARSTATKRDTLHAHNNEVAPTLLIMVIGETHAYRFSRT